MASILGTLHFTLASMSVILIEDQVVDLEILKDSCGDFKPLVSFRAILFLEGPAMAACSKDYSSSSWPWGIYYCNNHCISIADRLDENSALGKIFPASSPVFMASILGTLHFTLASMSVILIEDQVVDLEILKDSCGDFKPLVSFRAILFLEGPAMAACSKDYSSSSWPWGIYYCNHQYSFNRGTQSTEACVSRFSLHRPVCSYLHMLVVRRLLCSTRPVAFQTSVNPTASDQDLQQAQLWQLAQTTTTLPLSHGAFTVATTNTLLTEALRVPKLVLAGRLPAQQNAIYPLSINTMTSRTHAAAKPKAKTKGLHPESSSRVVWNVMKRRVAQTDSEDEGVSVENPNVIGDDMLNQGVVLNEMNKFIDSRTDDTPTPFGPLITDILSNPEALSKADNGDSGPYQIATNEKKDHGRFPKMNETQWKKSLGRIRESRANCGLPNPPLPDEVAGAEEEPQDVHRSPPLHAPPPVSVPPPPHWSMSYEEYRNMQASHEHLCRCINASELTSARNQYDLVSMFRVFTSQEPLPPFAPPFQEPFLPPNPKEWFCLGHGMSGGGGGDDFLFNGNES
ncbi:hypothetical protein RHGRI_029674 [Rhododendron griersonianum]|uniref:Uncharacterized protein n=1 Tax=Rhododendron griersonianum TaxID=479676 RepID=A0AAV6IMI8_9ERIC|nr:hypothetical protein RHGRI_029674 [Rhododendron griersonianum]